MIFFILNLHKKLHQLSVMSILLGESVCVPLYPFPPNFILFLRVRRERLSIGSLLLAHLFRVLVGPQNRSFSHFSPQKSFLASIFAHFSCMRRRPQLSFSLFSLSRFLAFYLCASDVSKEEEEEEEGLRSFAERERKGSTEIATTALDRGGGLLVWVS